MAKENAYDKYIVDLKKREQELRDDIEKQSTQLETKVRSGLILGLVVVAVTTVFFLFFKRSSKKSVKTAGKPKGNWIIRWVIESVSMEVIKRFWQARKAKFKDS